MAITYTLKPDHTGLRDAHTWDLFRLKTKSPSTHSRLVRVQWPGRVVCERLGSPRGRSSLASEVSRKQGKFKGECLMVRKRWESGILSNVVYSSYYV